MTSLLYDNGPSGPVRASYATPYPVSSVLDTWQKVLGVEVTADLGWKLALAGYSFVASDGDQNDRVTGQTSFANTTPTWMLRNPASSDRIVIPGPISISQTGTVAGGVIGIELEFRHSDAYASGGTSEGVSSTAAGLNPVPVNKGLCYSGATATAGYGRACGSYTLAQDVEPAEGIINVVRPDIPEGLMLWPGSSFMIFTYAATTGPTWGWHWPWVEVPISWLNL